MTAPTSLPFSLQLTALLLIILGSFCTGFIARRATPQNGRRSTSVASFEVLVYVLFLIIAFLLGILTHYTLYPS